MDMSWTPNKLAASTQFPGQILYPSGHHESDPHARRAQVQNSTYSLGGVDEGFARPPLMDAESFSNTQGVYVVNSSPMSEGGQPERGAHQTLSQHFQSNSIAGLEACSAEGFEGSVPTVDVTSGSAHDVELELNNRQQFEDSHTTIGGPRKRKRKRDSNWTKEETSVLVDFKEEAMREKGSRFCKPGKPSATNWDAVSAEMNKLSTTTSAKTGDQCRLRWDTLVKSYQKISLHCKKCNKEFSELTEDERGELRLATTVSEDRWYKVIDQFCRPKPRKARAQKRDDLSGVGSGRCSLGSSQDSTSVIKPHNCEPGKSCCVLQQISIPGFGSLSDSRRSTLVELVNGSLIVADLPWVSHELTVADTCQWLAIMQNRSRSNVSWDVNSLVKKKLLYKESAEDGKVHLNFPRLKMYEKFVRKVVSRNPDFDTFRRLWNNSLSTFDESHSFPQRITTLTLGGCPNLVKADLGTLPKLRCLVIVGCVQLEVITGWEQLTELCFLTIDNCPAYHNHPTVRRLSTLMNYFMRHVEYTNRPLPWSFEPGGDQFVRLCRLEVDTNQHLKETGDLSSLKCLQTLRFRRCNTLSTIQGLSELHSLTTLDLSFCCVLSDLPYLGHMKALALLDIFATSVEEINGIEELVCLEKLDCSSSKLKRLPNLYSFPQLQRITLRETPLVGDASSIYFGKDVVDLYGDEARRMEHVEVSDISDSEHEHTEYCGEILYSSNSSDI